MILTGAEIRNQVQEGAVTIRPFSPDQINPNSYDFRLGDTILQYSAGLLDARAANPTSACRIPKEGMVLERGRFYLGHTAETMGSNFFVPIIRAKSSIARLGLFVHVTADLIDIGSVNQWTLQLYPVHSIIVYPGMRIGQITFWKTYGRIDLYNGKYQGAVGPIASKSFVDS
jgi:dCTP deaminase